MLAEKINGDGLEENEVEFEVDADYKLEFLDTLKNSTRKFYSYILKLADEYEKEIEKPIYNFSISDRDEMLIVKYKNKNTFSFQSTLSPLKNYIDFCISKNLVKHFENRFSAVLPNDYRNYINIQAMENSYISKTKVRELENLLVNEQDKLIIELLSWGVRGRTEKGNTLEELINLKVSDIKYEEKLIYLTNNDGEIRYLDVDDFTLDLIKRTINKGFYLFNNGLKGKKNSEGIYEKTDKGFQINETEYVFRIPGKNKYGQIDHQLIANRIQRIQKYTQTPYLNISSLYFSSMIDEAKKIKAKNGILTKEDYIAINQKFAYGENGEIYLHKIKSIMSPYI